MAANARTAARTQRTRATGRSKTERPQTPEPEAELTAGEAQEAEAEGQYIIAELCGEDVQIVPPTAWRASWHRMLNQGQLDAFAEKVLHPDDYELYEELDPTILEFLQFTEDAAQRSGESLGKSRGPAASSRRTRRR
jgi:hypothetical protein